MRDDLLHPLMGTPILEWISRIPLGIDDDHVSLWEILCDARAFGLKDEDRLEFVRICLRSLLDAGAVPVDHMPFGSPTVFAPTDRFGTTREEIVEAVIADWLASGGGDLEWGEYPSLHLQGKLRSLRTERLSAAKPHTRRRTKRSRRHASSADKIS